jgi:hypothetical protein
MFPDETRRRQERLSGEIFHLAEKVLDTQKEEHLKIIGKLQMIYKDGFKHYYSDLFPVVLKMFEENNSYDVNYLTNNLETIRSELEFDYSNGTKQFDDIYLQFTKLCDHLNLQISELSVFSKMEDRTKDANELIIVMNEKLEQATADLEQATVGLENANKKADSLQTELIAVLSIFAAIVITFSGGITFLGSVMAAVKDVKYFESIILVAIVCGMVMFNTIFLMMYMVSKITDRDIYAKCTVKNCSCDNERKGKKCSGIKRIRKRLPYIFYFNLFAVIGMVIDMIIWFLDVKGKLI